MPLLEAQHADRAVGCLVEDRVVDDGERGDLAGEDGHSFRRRQVACGQQVVMSRKEYENVPVRGAPVAELEAVLFAGERERDAELFHRGDVADEAVALGAGEVYYLVNCELVDRAELGDDEDLAVVGE